MGKVRNIVKKEIYMLLNENGIPLMNDPQLLLQRLSDCENRLRKLSTFKNGVFDIVLSMTASPEEKLVLIEELLRKY